MSKIIGFDPGKQGGIVRMNDGVIETFAMPVIAKEFDLPAIREILDVGPGWHLFIEQVHAIFNCSAGSTFSFGGAFHGPQWMACGLGLPFTLVQPKLWQASVYAGVLEIRKAPITIKKGKLKGQVRRGPRDTKAMSLLAAKRLFPNVDLKANERCSVAHEGIVDALLIAEHGRLVQKGGLFG